MTVRAFGMDVRLAASLQAASRSRRWTREDYLVDTARRGDRRAFSELWTQYSPLVRRILLSMVNAQQADDLMQDVALRAMKSLKDLNDPKRFSAWICTIARNSGRNTLDRRSRAADVDSLEETPCDTVQDIPPSAHAEADEILAEIDRLPTAYREPLRLRLMFDCSGPEISKRCGLTPGSVRVNLCRGMKLLRGRLELAGAN